MVFFGILLAATIAIAQQAASSHNDVDGFIARTYRNARETMPYRLFVPREYTPQKKYPLIIWLHGGGGAGHDNLQQISEDQIPGTRTWTRPENQARYPSFVLVPQSSNTWGALPTDLSGDTLSPQLRLVVAILDMLKAEFSIDAQRIYVAGQSDGGYGTWSLVTQKPDLIAAAIPICGGGVASRAGRAAKVAIWAFHGSADKVVPVAASRQMVAALQKAGASPRYTEYKGLGHDIWMRAFAEPELVDWLFAQHK